MENETPPPPPNLARDLRDMKAGAYKMFPKNPIHSVRAAICRLKLTKDGKGRDFTTRPKGKRGCEVWRLK